MDDNGLTVTPEDRLPIEQTWGEHLRQYVPDDHLSEASLKELASQGKRMRDYSARMEHIVCCPRCRRQLKEIRAAAKVTGRVSSAKTQRSWFSFAVTLPNLAWSGGLGIVAATVILLIVRPETMPYAKSVPVSTMAILRIPSPAASPTPEVTRIATGPVKRIRKVQESSKQRKERDRLIVAAGQSRPITQRPPRKPILRPPAKPVQPEQRNVLARATKVEIPLPQPPEGPIVPDKRDVTAASADFTAAVLPTDLADLRAKGIATLGSEPGPPNLPPIQPLSGFGSYVRDIRPVLRWRAVKGATLYRIEIGDPDGAENLPPQKSDSPRFQPSEPLQRGRTYHWKVTAYDGRVTSSNPADKGWGKPLARTEWLLFRVLSDERAAHVEKEAETEKTARLAAAKIYAQYGLLDEAEKNLSELFKELKRPGDSEHREKVRKAARQLQDVITTHRRPKAETPEGNTAESGGRP